MFLILLLLVSVPDVQTIPHRHHEKKQIYLQKDAAVDFRLMAAAAAKDGIELIPISGYRNQAEQAHLYKKYGPIRAAQPGFSNHELGLAVDFSHVEKFISNEDISPRQSQNVQKVCSAQSTGWTCPTLTYWWLKRNAKKFGFVQTIEYEPWHWKYTGRKDV